MVDVGVDVWVGVGVPVAVKVGVESAVGVRVGVGVGEEVGVGPTDGISLTAQNALTDSHPSTLRSHCKPAPLSTISSITVSLKPDPWLPARPMAVQTSCLSVAR